MGNTTRLIVNKDYDVTGVNAGKQSEPLPEEIGHPRSIGPGGTSTGDEEIGHRKTGDGEAPGVLNIGHPHFVLDFGEPKAVRRVVASRGTDGNLHLDLEE